MLKMNFPIGFVSNIMQCVTSVSFAVLVNGKPAKHFLPSPGIRQGDAISPFLFIICSEGISALFKDAETKKAIHGLKIRKGDMTRHLFFADDSLLFIRANDEEVEKVLEILTIYEAASGQKLNMDKSKLCFSRNVEHAKQNML